MKKFGIKCRRVVDVMMFDQNWYVPDDFNPYCEDWENNPLYDTFEEAEQMLNIYKKDSLKVYQIYEVEI